MLRPFAAVVVRLARHLSTLLKSFLAVPFCGARRRRLVVRAPYTYDFIELLDRGTTAARRADRIHTRAAEARCRHR
ncbi:MAG TPA: hypothetical protein VIX63_08580 [Vicinamibacterales bacterium]